MVISRQQPIGWKALYTATIFDHIRLQPATGCSRIWSRWRHCVNECVKSWRVMMTQTYSPRWSDLTWQWHVILPPSRLNFEFSWNSFHWHSFPGCTCIKSTYRSEKVFGFYVFFSFWRFFKFCVFNFIFYKAVLGVAKDVREPASSYYAGSILCLWCRQYVRNSTAALTTIPW